MPPNLAGPADAALLHLLLLLLPSIHQELCCPGPRAPLPLQACVAELKAAGEDMAAFEEAAQRARQLIRESERLGVRMEGLVEQLQEHSRLYCLCQKAYDELRPMVGCDYCQVSARLARMGDRPRMNFVW